MFTVHGIPGCALVSSRTKDISAGSILNICVCVCDIFWLHFSFSWEIHGLAYCVLTQNTVCECEEEVDECVVLWFIVIFQSLFGFPLRISTFTCFLCSCVCLMMCAHMNTLCMGALMQVSAMPSESDCMFVKCLYASSRWELLWRLCREFQSESELQAALQTEEEELEVEKG